MNHRKECVIYMSLIICDNCGKEISDKATNCIHCGKKVNTKKSNKTKPIRKYWICCEAVNV